MASALFEGLLPEGVATFELAGAGDPSLLLPGERESLGGAGLRRAGEFAAGRQCARQAAACHGVVGVPIGTRADGRPSWPASLTGSITHTAGFAAAAVGERHRFRAVGIDAEQISGVSADLWHHVLRPAEMDRLQEFPEAARLAAAALMYSAKEAFYKCQFELTRQWLEFREIAVTLLGDLRGVGTCQVRAAGRFERGGAPETVRFRLSGGLVLTAMTLAVIPAKAD